jgi:hypothetical protein
VGDRIDLVNLPATIAGDGSASLLVQGWTEDIGSHRRLVTFTCTPETPWRVGEYEDAAGDPMKYDTAGTICRDAESTASTAFVFRTTVGPLWTTDAAEMPFDVDIGGERVTVTNIGAPSGSDQAVTVSRSVNGVVKAHDAGTPVRLWNPARYGL